ncbi:MAG: hypothetical protein MUE31_06145 [Candidatus Nanopelagicales bacterium]|nr:hypothetical protein [Candidatus Nanopelagicales bacterium]MCU0296492.1 hypothetical protein [Candidatus Nanopelagicales bacterium]
MAVHGLTVAQRREHVLAYLETPYGVKGRYLASHGISAYQIRQWRTQMYAGTLETGLVPRGVWMNDYNVNREVVRLREEVEALQSQLEAREVVHEQQLAAKQAEIDAAGRVAEALGKAIALLHAGNESAGSTTGQ